MAAGRFAVGRRAIAEFVDVESVFARREAGDVGDDFHFVAGFGERDGAFHVAPLGRVQDGDGFGGFVGGGSRRDQSERARREQAESCAN